MSETTMETRQEAGRYRLYQPTVERHYLHRDEPGGTHLFGHMVSIAYFDDRFHAVWNNHHGGHAQRYFRERGEPMPFQRLLWQTSPDCREWSVPVRITEEATDTPLDAWEEPHTHWQPNLLNYRDTELWCLWCIGEGAYFDIDKDRLARRRTPTLAGTYLSTLGPGQGAKWRHRRIFGAVQMSPAGTGGSREGAPEVTGYLFPSQNPALLKSGRVVLPVTFVAGDEYNLGSLDSSAYFSAVIYTDDDGATWQLSNAVSNVDNPLAQWEPHVMEQADGRLRMYIRDTMASRGIHEKPDLDYRRTIRDPPFLTTTGTGARKGEPVQFEPDAKRVWMEVESSRMHRISLPGNRYCMFHHDVWNGSTKGMRSNLALFFSRSDEDDYVAGPGIVGRQEPAHYAQGIAHEGRFYVGYTLWNTSIRTGGDTSAFGERGIAVSIVDPIPEPGLRYVWPRDKDLFASANSRWRDECTNRVYHRPALTTHDGKTCIELQECGSAGVEIDPVDFRAGQELMLSFDFRVLTAQAAGNLVLCSFGDRIPIRVGLPGNRPGLVYAYGRDDWQPIGRIDLDGWNSITVVFGADEFAVRLGESSPVELVNPIRFPGRRLYFGDGFEVDLIESNRGSHFLIDLDSIRTYASEGVSR